MLAQTLFYTNKNASTGKFWFFDQIIECRGFLWVFTLNRLVRINATDLDYMVFLLSVSAGYLQPPCTDGQYIYIGADESVAKINPDLLIGSFASYGYDGSAPVNAPVGTIIGECPMIQLSPNKMAYSHSMLSDANFIYVAATTSGGDQGYDAIADIFYLHFQKIDKKTMTTVGDVSIPKCTDDIVQDMDYVYLAPEIYGVGTENYPGASWGLVAIKKTTLEIKYLKALHSLCDNPLTEYRKCYGIFLFGSKMAVLNARINKTFMINTSQIDLWGENFPIGGATDAVYEFIYPDEQGAILANELATDSYGMAHLSSWENDTFVFKVPISEIGFEILPPVVQSILIQSLINSTTIGGVIISEGGSEITMVGLRYGSDSNNLDQIISFENPAINFQSVLNLTPGIYYFQAYAANSVGTSYGAIVPFVVGNTVILSHDSAGAAVALRNNNSGHAVRFCKRAWGVADGTIGSATDADGNVYKTVVINEIEWAAADLKTALYNNDDDIPLIENNTQWSEATAGARTYYNNILPT